MGRRELPPVLQTYVLDDKPDDKRHVGPFIGWLLLVMIAVAVAFEMGLVR